MNEQFNIHNLISFELINKTGEKLLQKFNPEYKYFSSKKRNKNHFQIIVGKRNKSLENCFDMNNNKWKVDIDSYFSSNILNIFPKNLGLLNSLPYLSLKNLYTRSLISLQIIDSNATLIHSSSFKINNSSFIFAGRPGVFKTSILMDAIRFYNAEFIGEENCLVHKSRVYSFPMNIDSISFKIRNYKSEEASSKIQKLKLGLHLLSNSNSTDYSIPIASPCKIQGIFFLVKGQRIDIKEVSFQEILPYLLDNEMQELSIPPTHSLSGINNNYFKKILEEADIKILDSFSQRLTSLLFENFRQGRFFLVTSPDIYTKDFTDRLIRIFDK